jgi:hypothetical protein
MLFSQPIPAGDYGQIRLMVLADGDPSSQRWQAEHQYVER